jgi:hypothetical protein
MAMTLADAQTVSPDPRVPGVLRVLQTSNVLNRTPFEDVAGGAFTYNQEATLPASAFRAVNAGYTESTGTHTTATESLVILGGEYVVDRFLERTRSGGIGSLVAEQRDMKARSVAAKYGDAFFNGDTAVDANSFNGLKKRLTGAQVLSSGANGAAINTDDATRTAFFNRLDELLAIVPGVSAIYTNRQVIAQIRIAFRNATIQNMTIDDLTGRPVEVPTWQGVPILDAGNKADQTQILPQTETAGTSTNTSSIYAVRYTDNLGEQGVVGLTNGGLQVDPPRELETKPAYMGRIEFYTGLALLGPNPAARLTGVIAA